jgi:hypothetical protein
MAPSDSLFARDVAGTLDADEVPAWVQSGMDGTYLDVALATALIFDSCACA